MPRQLYPYTQYFKKKLTKLLDTNTKIQYILDNLIALLIANKPTLYSINNQNVLLQKIDKINNDVLKIFKLGIFVHRCVIEISSIQSKYIIDKLIENCQKKYKCVNNVQLDQNSYNFFQNKIVLPYLCYLQRRSCYKIHKKNKQKQLQQQPFQTSIDYNISNIKQQWEPSIKENCIQKYIQKSYHIINLLNKALYMNKQMLSMIRYYSTRFAWIEDFNIIMGMDIGYLYGRLTETIQDICKYCQKQKQKLTIDDQNQISILKVVNQNLQLIYNSYYKLSKVSKYAPKRINTQKYDFLQKTSSTMTPQQQFNSYLNIPEIQSSKNMQFKIQNTLRQERQLTQTGQSPPKKWRSQANISGSYCNTEMNQRKYKIQPEQVQQLQDNNRANQQKNKNIDNTDRQENIRILAEMIEISKMFFERRSNDITC